MYLTIFKPLFLSEIRVDYINLNVVPSLAFIFDFVITVPVLFRSHYLAHISLKLTVNQLSMSCRCWYYRCAPPFIIFMTVHMNLYVVLMSLVCFYVTCNLCYSFKSLKNARIACFILFILMIFVVCLSAWWSLRPEVCVGSLCNWSYRLIVNCCVVAANYLSPVALAVSLLRILKPTDIC